MPQTIKTTAAIFVTFALVLGGMIYHPEESLAFYRTVHVGRGSIHNVAWNSTGELLAVDTSRATWIYTSQLEDVMHLEENQHPAFSPDGQWLATANSSYQIELWGADNFQHLSSLRGHHHEVTQIAWHPSNPNQIASIDSSGELIIWDVLNHSIVFRGHDIKNPVKITWNPSGDRLAAVNDMVEVTIWDANNLRLYAHLDPMLYWDAWGYIDFEWRSDTMFARGWSGDGGGYEEWDITTMAQTPQLSGWGWTGMDSSGLGVKSLSPDRQYETEDNVIYRLADRVGVAAIPISNWPSTVWSSDSSKIAAYNYLSQLVIYDFQNKQLIARSDIHARIGNTVSWRDDNRIIATASRINQVLLRNAQTGAYLASLDDHIGEVSVIEWQPGGTLVATVVWGNSTFASDDPTVRVWDTAHITDPMKPVASLYFPGGVGGIAWNHDGTGLAITAAGTLNIWNPKTRSYTLQVDLLQVLVWEYARFHNPEWSRNDDILTIPASSSGSGGIVVLIDARTGQPLNGGSPNYASDYVWSSDNRLIWANWGSYGCGGAPPPIYNVTLGVGYNPNHSNVGSIYNSTHNTSTMPGIVQDAKFTNNGDRLAGLDSAGNLIVWYMENDKPQPAIRDVENFDWSPDGELLLVDREDKPVQIIDSRSGRVFATLEEMPYLSWENMARWTNDSRRLAAVTDGTLTIWDSQPKCSLGGDLLGIFDEKRWCE